MNFWDKFGTSLLQKPEESLAAYLGEASGEIAGPTAADFRSDPVFDPNPHRLDLPADSLELMFFVRTLVVWGAEPLVRAAVVCSEIQLEASAPPERALAAAAAAKAFQASPSDQNRADARRAADACAKEYAPFEGDPDSPEATRLWRSLGACWFAAETAAQDYALTRWDGPAPAASSPTWGNRVAVWPQRAADAAGAVTSCAAVRQRIRGSLTAWLKKRPRA
jgi:hypothetical protein